MTNDPLKSPAAESVFNALRKHPQWDGIDPGVIEQELDIPVADPEEEEEGFYMDRKDRIAEVLDVMGALIERGYVEGSVSMMDDRLVHSGIRLTASGLAFVK